MVIPPIVPSENPEEERLFSKGKFAIMYLLIEPGKQESNIVEDHYKNLKNVKEFAEQVITDYDRTRAFELQDKTTVDFSDETINLFESLSYQHHWNKGFSFETQRARMLVPNESLPLQTKLFLMELDSFMNEPTEDRANSLIEFLDEQTRSFNHGYGRNQRIHDEKISRSHVRY